MTDSSGAAATYVTDEDGWLQAIDPRKICTPAESAPPEEDQ